MSSGDLHFSWLPFCLSAFWHFQSSLSYSCTFERNLFFFFSSSYTLLDFSVFFIILFLVGFIEILESDLMSFIDFRKGSTIISLNISSAHPLFISLTPITYMLYISLYTLYLTLILYVSFCYSCFILGIFFWTLLVHRYFSFSVSNLIVNESVTEFVVSGILFF